MKSEKEVQLELIYVWQIECEWIMAARKFTLSAEKERENIY